MQVCLVGRVDPSPGQGGGMLQRRPKKKTRHGTRTSFLSFFFSRLFSFSFLFLYFVSLFTHFHSTLLLLVTQPSPYCTYHLLPLSLNSILTPLYSTTLSHHLHTLLSSTANTLRSPSKHATFEVSTLVPRPQGSFRRLGFNPGPGQCLTNHVQECK